MELEAELNLTKENLQAMIEELEATNEELKSANEEYNPTMRNCRVQRATGYLS